MKIGRNTVVTLDYELGLEDGEIIESTFEAQRPFCFNFGGGDILPAFEEALEGREEGEEFEFSIPPDKAYGPVDEEAIRVVPRSQFPSDAQLEEGKVMVMETPEGDRHPFRIAHVAEDEVVLDFNHPLAGKVLYFKILVREVREATPDEILGRASGVTEQ